VVPRSHRIGTRAHSKLVRSDRSLLRAHRMSLRPVRVFPKDEDGILRSDRLVDRDESMLPRDDDWIATSAAAGLDGSDGTRAISRDPRDPSESHSTTRAFPSRDIDWSCTTSRWSCDDSRPTRATTESFRDPIECCLALVSSPLPMEPAEAGFGAWISSVPRSISGSPSDHGSLPESSRAGSTGNCRYIKVATMAVQEPQIIVATAVNCACVPGWFMPHWV
jgi:hypothetical protein